MKANEGGCQLESIAKALLKLQEDMGTTIFFSAKLWALQV